MFIKRLIQAFPLTPDMHPDFDDLKGLGGV